MAGESEGSDRVFIIRVWCESPSVASAVWRGSVCDIRTGERAMFSNVRDLVDVIGLHLVDERLSREASSAGSA